MGKPSNAGFNSGTFFSIVWVVLAGIVGFFALFNEQRPVPPVKHTCHPKVTAISAHGKPGGVVNGDGSLTLNTWKVTCSCPQTHGD
jgi:hypothetical protein